MQASTLKSKMNLSHAKALRRAREMMKVTRLEMARKLNLSLEAIKKYESGRANIDEQKINVFITALNITRAEYDKIKKGKGIGLKRRTKIVHSNQDRRSYKKIITKEVRVLKVLRQMKELSQDQASYICGYSRPTIGHIENGRIELQESRIRFIVQNYGFTMDNFSRLMKEEVLRDEILSESFIKMSSLSEDKLKIVNSIIQNF